MPLTQQTMSLSSAGKGARDCWGGARLLSLCHRCPCPGTAHVHPQKPQGLPWDGGLVLGWLTKGLWAPSRFEDPTGLGGAPWRPNCTSQAQEVWRNTRTKSSHPARGTHLLAALHT